MVSLNGYVNSSTATKNQSAPARCHGSRAGPGAFALPQRPGQSHPRQDKAARRSSADGLLTIKLAKEFGFCYGVERAIDLAYAARQVFPAAQTHLSAGRNHPQPGSQRPDSQHGHPDHFAQADARRNWRRLHAGDVVIIPAFGTEVETRKKLNAKGCELVDTTCGDVMSVWKRVRQYSKESVTSIIHGKAKHEETKATTSQATAHGQRPLSRRLQSGRDRLRLRLHPARRRQAGVPGQIQGRLFAGLRSGRPSAGRRRGQPDHHVARRNRGSAAPHQERHDRRVTARASWTSISAFSTPFAARPRTGRTRCKNCCASRWICCSSSAATIPPTPRTWRKWARPSCRPISSRTRPRWFPTSSSAITTCSSKRKWKRATGCRRAKSPSASPPARPARTI